MKTNTEREEPSKILSVALLEAVNVACRHALGITKMTTLQIIESSPKYTFIKRRKRKGTR